ncbi:MULTISPECIES: N-acetylglucosamine kinase [unclassified Streptomyces]|uniref:N-acetylglucosamine kinase n=1 Tax=unclassified Streptomyces TaxID=2593676 RepID=UPI001F1E4A0B|nr:MULTISPECIES: BadF/BadG/BcrA/BcrD ATPase family protein [unclassified Streptomyces]MCU4745943.1 ATPase [Streptomyces sp. G-5]
MSGPAGGWVLGVDSGGSGLRIALAGVTGSGAVEPGWETVTDGPVRTGGAGIDAEQLLERVLPATRSLLTRAGAAARVTAVCVGAAGMATLGADLRERLPAALEREFGVRRWALAADAVTGYAGALGERRGAVVAAGTGMIALGMDGGRWRRADGWGHLLGDSGSGAWIGQRGLAAALRAYDGRTGGSSALLERAELMFGPAGGLPGVVYPRSDRAAVLASFAPEVAACAGGDEVAAGILTAAALEIARSAAAVAPAGGEVALTGGLFRMGDPLLGPVRAELGRLLPGAAVTRSTGDPLAGALLIAGRIAAGGLRLPPDRGLLELG